MADPAERSFPYSGSPIPDEESFHRFQYAMGVWDCVVARTSTGPSATDLKVTANGTNTLTIQAGGATPGGFFYEAADTQTRTVPSNATGSTAKIHTVVVESSQTTNEATVKVIHGGAAPPELIQTTNGIWQMPLADVTVLAGSSVVAATAVTDRRVFCAPQPVFAVDGAAPTRLRPGQVMVRDDGVWIRAVTGWVKVWPEEPPEWQPFTDAITGAGWVMHSTTHEAPGYAKLPNGEVVLKGVIRAATTRPDSSLIVTLPAGYRPTKQIFRPVGVNGGANRLDVRPTGQVRCEFGPVAAGVYIDLGGVRFFTNT